MLAAITSPSPRRTGLNTAHVIIMLSARIRIARTIPLITNLKVNPKKPANYCSPKCVNDLRYAGMGTRKTRALPGRGRRVSSKNAVTCCREHAVALRKLSEAHKEAMSPEQAKDEGTATKACAFPDCGVEFVPNRKTAKYCSNDHYSTCEICGKQVKVERPNLGRPPRACCPSHAVMLGHIPESKAKRGSNSIDRWGTKTPSQSDEVKEKIRKTLDAHPESDHRFGSKNFTDQIKAAYGVDNVSKLDEAKDQKKETALSHYGVGQPMQAPEAKAKIPATHASVLASAS